MRKTLWMLPLAATLLSGCAVRDFIRTLPCCEDSPPPATRSPARCDILFALDKADVRSADMPKISAWAERLTADPDLQVRLEGHADERGESDYNTARAMRRNESVKKALMAKGAKHDQIELLSLGEDQPLAEGSGEDVWQQNRCVNVVE